MESSSKNLNEIAKTNRNIGLILGAFWILLIIVIIILILYYRHNVKREKFLKIQ